MEYLTRHSAPHFAALLLALACASGCDAPIERSAAAVSLARAAHDDREENLARGAWPGWRGDNACGISPDTNLPVQWTATRGVRWKVSVPGRGNSSPVVWGDHLLVTSEFAESEGADLIVYSFDCHTGERQWERRAAKSQGSTHNKNGFASATVATDGQTVFASFGAAGLFAFDLRDGRQLWRANLGTLEHQWGVASSPVLVDNLVIQLCDSAAGSKLQALFKSTGHPVWSADRASTGCWTTPVLLDVEKARQLVVNGTGTDGRPGNLIAYDPADGREIWRAAGTTDVVCPTAIVASGLVVSTSGRNGPIFAVRPGAGDITATGVVWKLSRGGPYVPTGVAYRNRLYIVADGGVVSSYNLGNGDIIWRDRLKGNFSASLVAADGKIYATSEYGVVYVFEAADKFNLLAENDLDEPILATPAIAKGDLFIRAESHLYCIAASPNDQSQVNNDR
jgi:outer membrane protein assembly factor BamB